MVNKKVIIREAIIFLIFASIGLIAFRLGVFARNHELSRATFNVLSRIVGLGFSCTFILYPLYLLARLVIWLVRRFHKPLA